MFEIFPMTCYFTGLGVITKRDIFPGEYLAYYSGVYLERDPDGLNDDYIYEFHHKKKTYWSVHELFQSCFLT